MFGIFSFFIILLYHHIVAVAGVNGYPKDVQLEEGTLKLVCMILFCRGSLFLHFFLTGFLMIQYFSEIFSKSLFSIFSIVEVKAFRSVVLNFLSHILLEEMI